MKIKVLPVRMAVLHTEYRALKPVFIAIYACLLLLINCDIFAQSNNYRAQGNYYSAKSAFTSGNYTEALNYIYKSKTTLGGTNYQLQYLHIITAYRLKKYEEAAKEMEVYFNIEDDVLEPIPFDKDVDRLTNDETRELSMLIDPILESVEHRKNNPCHTCSGTGMSGKRYSCSGCNGSGKTKQNCPFYDCYGGQIPCPCQKCYGGGCGKQSHCAGGSHVCELGGAIPCSPCQGRGEVPCNNCSGSGKVDVGNCGKCSGSGLTYSSTEKECCQACQGNGFIK